MNRYQTERSPFDYGASVVSPPASSHSESAMPNNFAKDVGDVYERTGLEPVEMNQAARSSLADLQDPIQVHLLTETALSDSKDYDILTQEEVDKLKKQCQMLSQRVDSTRANLAIQSKYRDAAVSMAKLHATGKTEEELRNDQNARDAEMERKITEKKCDELSRELFDLEKRLLKPQRRLLQHTAGILQLTHKVSKKKAAPTSLDHGVPGSPESLYTFSHGRDSLGPALDDTYFDEQGLYHLDGLQSLQLRQAQRNLIEIPLKSPVREQANQLRGEVDKAKEEKLQLLSTITETEQKLEKIGISLRETIVRFNPDVNMDYLEPPRDEDGQNLKPGELLKRLVDYLESGLVAVQAEQESFSGGGGNSAHVEPVLVGLWGKMQSGFAEKKQRKEERRKHRAERGLPDDDESSDDDGFDASESYNLTSFASKVEWLYSQASTLKDQKSVLKRQIKQQRELNNKTDAEKDEELERRQDELDRTRQLLEGAEKDAMDAQTMLADALEDLEQAREAAGSAGADQAEVQAQILRIESLEADIEARSTRMESLEAEGHARNGRIESLEGEVQARNVRVESLEAEIEARSARVESLEAEIEARSARVESLEAEIEARSARVESLEAEIEARSARVESLEADVEARGARIEQLEGEIQVRSQKMESIEAKAAVSESENKSTTELKSQLEAALKDKTTAEEGYTVLKLEVEHGRVELSNKERELARKEDELEQLGMTLAELKTEVTIARAELDGAYGTRAERAADVAALKNNAEVVKLSNHVERLKKELAGTIQDLEIITKETIGAERERIELEHKLDESLSTTTILESDLQKSKDLITKLQEDLDSERFKVVTPGGTGRPGPGASMLSEQFRTTMREERKKFQEDIKEERARARKLEEELNRLKRGLAPGRGPLSPRSS